MKALVGDTSDNISGYYGIGPVKGKALLEDYTVLADFFKIKGHEIYNTNMLLIDLSMCPRILDNTRYIQKQLAHKPVFDKDEINKLIMRHKINGLQQEFADLVMPFKNLK